MASVRKHRTRASTWLLDYRDRDGKRHQLPYRTKADAEAARVRIEGELSKGTHIPESQQRTVREACEAFFSECEALGRRRVTLRSYRTRLDRIDRYLGREKLPTLTVGRIERFFAELHAEGCSVNLQRTIKATLSAVINRAMRNDWVTFNPVTPAKIRVRADKNEKPTPTRDEIALILDAMRNRGGRYYTATMIGAYAGLRLAEVRALQWRHIDLDAGVIRVRQSADEFGTIHQPKSAAGRRDIDMPSKLIAALREWYLASGRPASDAFVIASALGHPLFLTTFRKYGWKPALQAAGLTDEAGAPRFTFHSLRHAYASSLIAAGRNPRQVQRAMGHSDVAFTMNVYSRAWEAQGMDTAEARRAALDAALG